MRIPSKSKRGSARRALTTAQVESALRHILTSTLALYVLHNARKPIAQAVENLTDMELRAGHLVGLVLRLRAENLKTTDLKGTLAAAFSYIPIPSRRNTREESGTPRKLARKSKPSKGAGQPSSDRRASAERRPAIKAGRSGRR
jgi:hypothetical protein